MSSALINEIKGGQQLAARCHYWAFENMMAGRPAMACYWQTRGRMHAARARSMLFDYQEDCHG